MPILMLLALAPAVSPAHDHTSDLDHEVHDDCWDSVYRTKPDDPKQKQWYIFDSALILPEYLVEYENISIDQAEAYL